MIVCAVVDTRSSPGVETFVQRENVERFIAEVLGGDPDLAGFLRIEEDWARIGELVGHGDLVTTARNVYARHRGYAPLAA